MIVKRDLIIAVLATFCLTATLFMVLPTESSPAAEYDPWADMNDDGTINILDIANVAVGFGTSGDPTKNVTIMQSYYEWAGIMEIAPQDYYHISNRTAGYRKVSMSLASNASVTVEVTFYVSVPGYGAWTWSEGFDIPSLTTVSKTYDVKGSVMTIYISNPSNTAVASVHGGIYLTT